MIVRGQWKKNFTDILQKTLQNFDGDEFMKVKGFDLTKRGSDEVAKGKVV